MMTTSSDNETTTADALRAKGYATAVVGKWHLGQREEYLPHHRGFDEYLGVPCTALGCLELTQPRDLVLRETGASSPRAFESRAAADVHV